ncbi:class I SAM-dependent DNA methyltransferase [Micromonospora globispora]|uniref:class I SAM-dependent DNA methyltransferase n=1 Tax=Micromonospora globispora TaxID=1450148 RepID=UPI000F5EB3A4|nr:DNA methyltransferase [Micromonospora globispora]RQW91978.1 SAM-dependent methyltransferase [Micromonospora globispora]
MPEKPISWNDIRERATRFVADWRGETRENAEAQTFWNEWFEIFGIKRRRYIQFERKAIRQSTGGRGRIDAFWEGQIAVEHKSAGKSLAEAEEQALDYLNSLDNIQQPRMVITSDFATFRVLDLEQGDVTEFPLDDLPTQIERFGFIAGYESRTFKPEDEVNIKAAEMMGSLYDALEETGYQGHDLKVFLVRLMFVFFADDTGVWEKGLFSEFLETRTSEDGSDNGALIERLFRVLDTPESARTSTLDPVLNRFPYVNGGLFQERINIPDFNSDLRNLMIACSAFDWSAISPAIFGSMFQSVMDRSARRALGAHYTSERNIMKLIGPLFLDELRADFESAKNSVRRLRELQDRLGSLTFFDPAAGCGNFLVVAYRELRRLEFDVLVRLDELTGHGQQHLSIDFISALSKVDVDQFYAIEIEEFPARIAETAIYLVDHLENMRLSKRFGQYFARIPLRAAAHVHVANAVRVDWREVITPEKCCYILGNPPFVGRQYRSSQQQQDMEIAFGGARGNGVLDYVTAWYAKAVDYMRGTQVRAAFVSTNSISQGENVGVLWPAILDAGFAIDFAHRTFQWTSEARRSAGVHVVIAGFSWAGLRKTKLLFDYPDTSGDPVVKVAANINPYLIDAPNIIVKKSRALLSDGYPAAAYGSMCNDGGHLIVEPADLGEALADPVAARYLRPYIGTDEMLKGIDRRVLWLADASPSELRRSAFIKGRIEGVRRYRLDSRREVTRRAADTPSLFTEPRPQAKRFLLVPYVSSEKRRYVPMRFYEPDTLVRAPSWCIPGADEFLFGILQSGMFMVWVNTVAGRLESRLQLSPGTIYNTFPFPRVDHPRRGAVEDAARAVLISREGYGESTLGELYDPMLMPPGLMAAHKTLDRAVESLFGRRKLAAEADRQAILFEEYQKLASPLLNAGLSSSRSPRKSTR